MASFWKHNITLNIFGESQGPAIGVVLDNLPPGETIDPNEIRSFLNRRMQRNEAGGLVSADMPSIMSGFLDGHTTGTPLSAFITNADATTANIYEERISNLARPGHADYTGALRYKGFNDVRKNGHFSERLTAPLCFAGSVCGQILERRGIYSGTHIAKIHNIKDDTFDPCNITRESIMALRHKAFPVLNDRKGRRMRDDISRAEESGDSLGGIIECAVTNVPAGVGSPIFEGLENSISQLVFAIPGVRGIEFGAGFESASMLGSQMNDEFYVDEHGYIMTQTNHHGGILGGISSGMPVVFRVAVRPSADIAKPMQACDMNDISCKTISPKHVDACSVSRLVPCVEAAANIAVLSHMLDYPNF